MPNTTPEDYLAKAKQAEEAATKSQILVAKRCWLTIAETYRMLAADKQVKVFTSPSS
jgi:hypothetical protein